MKTIQFILGMMFQLLEIIFQHALLWLWLLLFKFVYVLMGMIFGLIIGWFFGGIILGILAEIGITGYAMWQIGAFLGFVGSFFGGTTNFNNFTKQNQQPDRPPYNYPRR